MTTAEENPGQGWTEDAVDSAGGLDLLLTDAALGVWRRFRPDSSVLHLAGELAKRPGLIGRQAAKLGAELGQIAVGRSSIAASPRDRRFADPAWKDNPLLRRAVQAYLAAAAAAEELVAGAELDWRDETRLKFLLTNLIAAGAPSNNPLLSPEGWKAFIDTGGENAVRGLRHLASDLATSPRVPSMVPSDAYQVGKDLAVTPGGVVHATDQFELIQYQPVTETVYRYPLLVVPPMINKYYIVDLAPGRSMVEFLVSMGHQVFVMSWRNPDARHRDWGLDTYGAALTDALAAVRAVSGAAKVHVCALCSGGIMTSMVAAHLAVTGQLDQLASLCLGVAVLDQTQAGTAAAAIDEKTAAAAMAVSSARGYLDGRALAEVFAWLRPDDLIWSYWINNYLRGKTPPAFDILYWNADVTRLPAALHHDFLRLGLANALVTPGAATMLGSPVDLGKVDVDAYLVAGITDHLCPWESCYRTTQLLGGPVKFVLSTSGHIAAMVNPPTNPKAAFRCVATGANPADAGEFLASADVVPGSWWTDYAAWLAERGGGQRKSPRTLGRKAYPVRAAAPGTYVHDR
ncbi:MAG TPA: alpha/beta fold hydrolase [Streptosporangiaceae bacterium]|nr:alpha/beta fold hydrolase [Streptosporangiaceae bacterium]